MTRRQFAGIAASAVPLAGHAPIPIIDTHIHLFDTSRPQGVPWPAKDDPVLYKPALPARYMKLAQPLGVVGAIEVEASPWLEDNQWVLDIAVANPIIVGTVGDLEPGKPEFRKQLERFHRNPLFRGIRYGNLWGRDLAARIAERAFTDDLRVLAQAGLVLDTANPDTALVHAVVRLTDIVPELRIIIDHLPNLQVPREAAARQAYEADLRKLGERPQVFVKVSQVLQLKNREEVVDQLWNAFGEDRLLYGSDWPNSDPFGTYSQVLAAVRPYFEKKGRAAAEKYFWKNSLAAYRWTKRDAAQPNT
ncbi:MAG TPA: amidohydrolase family protein [Bryobacteraceae bacterium]|jgi:predicted TIM-barrel fold metal-dependent hydrolase